MAETITIICPSCEKSIKAPEDVVGKKIRCKGCGETFTAKPPKAPKAAKPAKKSEAVKPEGDDGEGGAYGMRDEYLGARCPECAEKMEDGDVICLTCGYNTVTRLKAQRRRVKEQTGGDYFWWLLPGILCALATVFLLLWMAGNLIYRATRKDLAEMDKLYVNAMDCCLLWFTIGQIYLIYKSTRFAIRRLILNPHPPEVEVRDEEA
jgi:hypothetical protein